MINKRRDQLKRELLKEYKKFIPKFYIEYQDEFTNAEVKMAFLEVITRHIHESLTDTLRKRRTRKYHKKLKVVEEMFDNIPVVKKEEEDIYQIQDVKLL